MEAKHNDHSWICNSRIRDIVLEKLGVVHTNYCVLMSVMRSCIASQPALKLPFVCKVTIVSFFVVPSSLCNFNLFC